MRARFTSLSLSRLPSLRSGAATTYPRPLSRAPALFHIYLPTTLCGPSIPCNRYLSLTGDRDHESCGGRDSWQFEPLVNHRLSIFFSIFWFLINFWVEKMKNGDYKDRENDPGKCHGGLRVFVHMTSLSPRGNGEDSSASGKSKCEGDTRQVFPFGRVWRVFFF